VIFETERLRARDWRADDAEAVYEIYRDPDVVRFLGSVPTPVLDVAEAAGRVERWTAYNAAQAGTGYGFWALSTHAGEVVGATLLKPLPEAEEVEVGWHLGKAHWGNGYATEGARGAVEHGFGTVGLDVVYAVVYSANVASLAVTRRLGMTHEGTTDRYYGVELELFSLHRP
jgi:RimJ/RimL family protein N-acetyltransferase